MSDISHTDDTAREDTPKLEETTPVLPHLQQQQNQQQQQQQLQQAPSDTKEDSHPEVSKTDTNTDNVLTIDYEKEAKLLEDKSLRFLAKQTHTVIIPSFANWFKLDDINQIEKNSLPEFFNDSSRFKSPKAYKDVRNFMINTYRLSPYEYLTITAVRRNIAMDIASIVKIHSFLETWGLINYQIDPRSKPSLIGPSFTGHFQIILDTPNGLKPCLNNELIDTKFIKKNQNDENTNDTTLTEKIYHSKEIAVKDYPDNSINLSLRKNIYDSTQDFNILQKSNKNSINNKQLQKTYVCHTCGNDTINIRYHNLRARNINICSNCFQSGRFSANFQATDFIRLNNNYKSNKSWSDQELLLLLEGIEMFEDQWDLIVEHIGGNKNLEDCVEKFLTLPIEDNYINDIRKKNINNYNNNNTNNNNSNNNNTNNDTNNSSLDTIKAIDLTIKALLNGLHEKTLNESIPNSAKKLSEKYLMESQGLIQELVNLSLNKLDSKLEQINVMESTLQKEKIKYIKETEKLLNDKILLSQQIIEINNELSKLNISKKLVLNSEQTDSTLAIIDKTTQEEDDELDDTNDKMTSQLKKKSNDEIEALSVTDPQSYKVWSL